MFGSHLFQTSCPQYTGIADKDIQTSECTNRFVDQFAQTGRIGYIGLNENSSVTFSQGVEILCCFRSSNFVQVGNDDVGALLNQATCDALAETLGCTGNDDCFVFNTTGCRTGTHFTPVVFDLPVVNEVDLCLSHWMLTAERLCEISDLHHVLINLCNDVASGSIISDSYQTDAFDQNHFRSITVFCFVSVDLLLSGCQNGFSSFAVDIDVVRFAVNDNIG